MEIDLGFGREGAAIGIAALVALLIGLALLGRAVTPLTVDEGTSQPRALILTPERWQAARLARPPALRLKHIDSEYRPPNALCQPQHRSRLTELAGPQTRWPKNAAGSNGF